MRLRANAICQREDVMFVWDLNSNLVEGMIFTLVALFFTDKTLMHYR